MIRITLQLMTQVRILGATQALLRLPLQVEMQAEVVAMGEGDQFKI